MSQYRYPHFTWRVLSEELHAMRSGPQVGQPLPDFELPTTEGGVVRSGELIGDRPLLVSFASYT